MGQSALPFGGLSLAIGSHDSRPFRRSVISPVAVRMRSSAG